MPRLGFACVRKYAVQSPVNPPPTMTTSAVTSPVSGGQDEPLSRASASRSHQLLWAPGVRA